MRQKKPATISGLVAPILCLLACTCASADNLRTSQLEITWSEARVTSVRNLLSGEVFAEADGRTRAGVRVRGEADTALQAEGVSLDWTRGQDGTVQFVATPTGPTDSVDEIWVTFGPFPSANLRVLSPMWDGCVVDGRADRDEYTFSGALPVVLLDTGAGGLCLWAVDECEPVKIVVLRSASSVAIALCQTLPRLQSGSSVFKPVAWRLAPYADDWHNGADRYTTFLEDEAAFVPLSRRTPSWMKDITGVARIGHDGPSMVDDLRRLAQRVDPAKVLVYLADWRTNPYDHMYPDYTASVDGAAIIRAARDMGFRVMPHGNYGGIDPRHPRFPEFEAQALRFPNGSVVTGADTIVQLDHSYAEVRKLFVDAFAASYAQCPFDAIHLDYPAIAQSPRQPGQTIGPYAASRVYLDEMRKALPSVAIGTEWLTSGLVRDCSFVQTGWLVLADKPLPDHPVGGYILGRYRHLYVHLGTPHQNEPPSSYGALLWFARLAKLGGLPTLYVDHALDLDGDVARVMVEAIREGLPVDDEGAVKLPGVVYGMSEATAPEGLRGWVAQDGERAFGLDPDSAYLHSAPGTSSPGFRLRSCSTPARVTGGADAIRGYVTVYQQPGSGQIDLLSAAPSRTGIVTDGSEGPLAHRAAYRKQEATCGGITREAVMLHPPWGADITFSRASAFVEYVADVPAEGTPILTGYMGRPDLPEGGNPGDGVVFRAHVNGQCVLDHYHRTRTWEPLRVSLANWRGKQVSLRLEVDAGPAGDTGYDTAFFGEMRITGETSTRVVTTDDSQAQGVVVEDADGVRVVEPTTRSHEVRLPATVMHVYRAQPPPATGKLIDAPFGIYFNLGGAVTPVPAGTPHYGAIGDYELDDARQRLIGSPTPAEGQTHIEWLLDLPPSTQRLETVAMCRKGAHQRRRFEVWVNGLKRWQADVGMPRDEDLLLPVSIDLSAYAGKPTLITLVVDALGSNHFDWANWVEPRVVF